MGDEAPDLLPIDMAGVARVLEHERRCGREPQRDGAQQRGFDVESFDKRGELVRRIEIKSTGGQWSIAGVMLSRRQQQQAVEDGDLFWLYVVENAQDDDYRIYRSRTRPAGSTTSDSTAAGRTSLSRTSSATKPERRRLPRDAEASDRRRGNRRGQRDASPPVAARLSLFAEAARRGRVRPGRICRTAHPRPAAGEGCSRGARRRRS